MIVLHISFKKLDICHIIYIMYMLNVCQCFCGISYDNRLQFKCMCQLFSNFTVDFAWIKLCLNKLTTDSQVAVVTNVTFTYICNISCTFCALTITIINVRLLYPFVFDYLLNDSKISICPVKCFLGDSLGLSRCILYSPLMRASFAIYSLY